MPAPAASSAPSAGRKPPLPALTGIRTLLAGNIVLFHFTPPHTGLADPFIRNGYVFVGFFFLLSGYVLAYNYEERALTLNIRAFWTARFARLYPVYVLALLLSAPMLAAEWSVHTHADFWRGMVLTPLLLQAWSPSLATFWNTVGWTLSAEVLLYAAFPWIIRAWAIHLPRLNTPARLTALFFALWLAGMIPHTLYLLFNPDHLASPADRYTYGLWLRMLKYSPPAYLCISLAGIALGKLHHSLAITPRQRFAIAAIALAAVLLAFYTTVASIPYVILHGGLLMPLFALLTIGLSGANPIAAAFSWRPLLVIGESTFCLYMLHFNSINLLRDWHVWERLHLIALDPWISYAFVILLALAAHRWVEKPAGALLLRRLGPSSQQKLSS